jgi:hypothetical protein
VEPSTCDRIDVPTTSALAFLRLSKLRSSTIILYQKSTNDNFSFVKATAMR